MKSLISKFETGYRSALEECIDGAGEYALQRAYELGRQAVQNGLGVMNVISVHEEQLQSLISNLSKPEEFINTIRLADKIFAECLAPFEFTHRGFNELEIKVLERTEQLSEINRSLLAEIEERKRTEARLRSAQNRLRAMAAEIVMAEERSRQQFAAELHDTVVQTMAAAKLRSQLIQNNISQESIELFMELQDMISQSITQARLIMAEMSPPVLNELGFIPAIEWVAEQIENQHGIEIEFQAKDSHIRLVHEIQILLFQATRELLMNVVKHAKADKALVKVSGVRQKVRIEVIDDGRGFDKRQAFRTDVSSGGFGLFSIRERLKHFGGHFLIQSELDKGTRVVITAPLAGPTRQKELRENKDSRFPKAEQFK